VITKEYEMGKLYRSQLHGSSMMGEVNPGDSVIWKRIPFDQVKAGDLVIFRRGKDLVLHQADEPIADGWKTKGVNNRFRDTRIMGANDFLGVVVQK
jgi:hypothetical protein